MGLWSPSLLVAAGFSPKATLELALSVRPSVRPSVRNKMCPRRFLCNRWADSYEIQHAISPISLVDAQHFKLFYCLMFQTLFRHFRPWFPWFQLLCHNGLSLSAVGGGGLERSASCSKFILLILWFYILYFNLYYYYTVFNWISRIRQKILIRDAFFFISSLLIVWPKGNVFCMTCLY